MIQLFDLILGDQFLFLLMIHVFIVITKHWLPMILVQLSPTCQVVLEFAVESLKILGGSSEILISLVELRVIEQLSIKDTLALSSFPFLCLFFSVDFQLFKHSPFIQCLLLLFLDVSLKLLFLEVISIQGQRSFAILPFGLLKDGIDTRIYF